MAVNDPIADLLTRIRNASLARHRFVEVPKSKAKLAIVKLLMALGYIEGFLSKEDNKQGMIRIYLRYRRDRQPVIQGLKRVSSPGCRKYVTHKEIPSVLGGMGSAILSTPEGIIVGKEARERKVGGEVLCYVW